MEFIYGIVGFFKKLLTKAKRKEAEDVIYSAELATVSGASVIDILKNVMAELSDNRYLENAVKLLSKGKQHNVAYKDILPSDIIAMLKSAETKKFPAEDIFANYAPMRDVIKKAESKMQGALLEPTISYFFVGLIAFFAINTFYTNFKIIPHADISTIHFIRDWYVLILLSPMALVHFILMKYPERVPIWRNVYNYVKAANYLLIIRTMVIMGMSTTDAIGFLKRLGDKQVNDRIKNIKAGEQNVIGLTKAMSYYLKPVEIALMKTSVKLGRENETLSMIVEQRMKDVDKTVAGTSATFSGFLKMFSLFPVGLVVYSLVSILSSITGGLGK